MAENCSARLKQAYLASKNYFAKFINKSDFDNKLLSFNEIISSNKTKYVLVEKELNELSENLNYCQQKIIVFSSAEYTLQGMMDLKTCLFINQSLTC